MLNTSFSPWPSFTDAEADAVRRVLLSNRVNYWTGDEAREFEREFAAWCGCRHAVALHNGTAALELALLALDIGPGDEVIVTPRTFIASASAVVMVGATPIFADVDPDSQNITVDTIAGRTGNGMPPTGLAPVEANVERGLRPPPLNFLHHRHEAGGIATPQPSDPSPCINKDTPGPTLITDRTKAIICVHLAGWPCDMDPIMAMARAHGLKVVEDCAQAHGARYKGAAVGTIGDIGAWSFCQDKIMTTGGEGGMVTTNDADLWRRMWSLKDHGKSWEAVYERRHAPGFRWLHDSFGTNARMLELQAVIGRIQLTRMPEWTRLRTANAARLQAVCARHDVVRVPVIPDGIEHAWYRYYAFVRPERLAAGWSRDRIVATVVDQGVPCYQGSCSEVYREQAFVTAGMQPPQRLPVARELGDTAFCLLVHPTLTEAEMDRACTVLDSVLAQADS